MTLLLISTQLSPCCSHEAQIVRSRQGGFVSRNCLKCGASHYVNEDQIPKLPCGLCTIPVQITKNDGTNYFFECRTCQEHYKIADIVPPWSQEFQYSGLAAYGDPGLPY